MVLAVVSNPSDLDDSKYNNLISTLSSTEDLSSIVFLDDSTTGKTTHDFSKFNPVTTKATPSLFQIENIQILLLPKKFLETLTFDFKTSDPITSMLKKRHLTSSFILNTHTSHDEFVLTEVPDIIISNSGETMNKNYKGTTIISNSNPAKIFLINSRTREVTEKNL
jgi:DNA polymerase II small subunit/DNA polymerase delta subunit B